MAVSHIATLCKRGPPVIHVVQRNQTAIAKQMISKEQAGGSDKLRQATLYQVYIAKIEFHIYKDPEKSYITEC